MTYSEFAKLNLFDRDWQARRAYARMKKTQPLPRGRCGLCDRDMETLYPILVDLCKICAGNVPERGGRLIRVKRYFMNDLGECLRCHRMVPKIYLMNVEVCLLCMRKWDPSGRRSHTV